TFSITGTISPANFGSGVTVTLSGAASATVTADGSGNYSFNGLANGSYTVTPSKSGYTFTPANRSVTVNGAPVSGVNFSAAVFTGSISGTISPASGGSGATVTLSGAASATVTADSSGNYSFNGLANGAYGVTPSKGGYAFTPASQSVSIDNASLAGINFTAQQLTGSVSGTITPASAGSGALVVISGVGNVIADSSGNYTFPNVPYGTYDVSAGKTGYSFTPVSRSVTVAGAVSGVDFTGHTNGSLSGTISPASLGSGATVTLSGALLSTTADSSGHYSFSALGDGTYTVVP